MKKFTKITTLALVLCPLMLSASLAQLPADLTMEGCMANYDNLENRSEAYKAKVTEYCAKVDECFKNGDAEFLSKNGTIEQYEELKECLFGPLTDLENEITAMDEAEGQ